MNSAAHTPTPNTNEPPRMSAVKLSPQQIDALARFYELGLTPADKELLSALRELSTLRNSHDALVALLGEVGAHICNSPAADKYLERVCAALKAAKENA